LYLKTFAVIGLAASPIMMGLFVVAEHFVLPLLGRRGCPKETALGK
jgi:hypothetical protein